MKILARHLTIDMYKCKESCFTDMEQLVDKPKTILAESTLQVVSGMHQLLPDGHAAIMILFNEGHMTVHAFPELRYISADTFGVRWEKGIAVKEGGFELLSPEIPDVCPELLF